MEFGNFANKIIEAFVNGIIFRLKCFLLPAVCGAAYCVMYVLEASPVIVMAASIIMTVGLVIYLIMMYAYPDNNVVDLPLSASGVVALVCVVGHLLLIDFNFDWKIIDNFVLVICVLSFIAWGCAVLYQKKEDVLKTFDNKQEEPSNELPSEK